ncbi:paraslipin [Trichothermofontia sichuanensis B231]|uniref:SPFH domain-containing protein n=1 Tax=Trichothermofontia sichuanensis TaxID=3045816 RepID=UPI0022457D63|nr:stomatin-like protein [Trichothermofontia sichuanensis]UZQ55818.1 paraslipin [Trichothermofontia sichuanensis B231]
MELLTFAILALLLLSAYTYTSIKIINQGNRALVERLGRYHRTLGPGLNFIVPLLDKIVYQDTDREQVLDVKPQRAITKDNVSLTADAVVYWRIFDLEQSFYAIDDIRDAINTLVLTILRSEIANLEFEETLSSRQEINRQLLQQLDEATENWGVKVMRVEVKTIEPAPDVLESMQKQQAAEIQKRASITATEATVESIQRISKAIRADPQAQEVLRYLIADKYIESSHKLGDSPNAKILFMDPKAMNEAMAALFWPRGIRSDETSPPSSPPPPNGSPPQS